MKKEGWITVLLLMVGWTLLGVITQNEYLIPSPLSVMQLMVQQMTTLIFYQIIMATCFRMLKGLLLSFLLAIGMTLLENRFGKLKEYFKPILLLSGTIPTITYIIICLIWFGQEGSVIAIIFFVLFPTFYAQLSLGLSQFHQKTDVLLHVYPVTEKEKSFKLLLPMMSEVLINAFKLAFALGLKVSVMAEIMGQTKPGIGRMMNLCKLNADMAGIFAWTFWILILCLIINLLFDSLLKWKQNQAN